MDINRRTFLLVAASGLAQATTPPRKRVETVRGPANSSDLGTTLIHEHVLVDFIGAEKAHPSRYDADEVFRTALPRLKSLYDAGCRTLVECTPAYLGRDPVLLRRLSEASNLHIVTNTGFYGANEDKHVPTFAWSEPADSLARRWTREYHDGIDKSGIRPGFLKIGVDSGPVSGIDAKLVSAACLCHKSTGLRMHIHTGDGAAGMSILEIADRHGVAPAAWVWVHAQNEKSRDMHIRAARAGAWVSFDGVGERRAEDHARAVTDMIEAGYLRQLLISQDSGWYRVGEPGGGQFNGYTYLFEKFVPLLKSRGVTDAHIRTLLVENPARVLT